MNTKRILDLMEQDARMKLNQYFINQIEIFQKRLRDILEDIYKKEVSDFQEKIRLDIIAQQEELIAEYLIKFEFLEDPINAGSTYILKVGKE